MTGLAMLAYLFSVLGYPLPLPAAKDSSTPFPCQGHECGCHSAQQCWESCCCYTPAERLAWARRHKVHIPREVQLAMACQSCDRHEPVQRETCCAEEHPAEPADDGCETWRQEQTGVKLRFAFGFQAQKCQGLTTLWIASGTTLPLGHRSLWEFQWVQVGHVCPPSRQFSAHVSPPPVPPPRAIADGTPCC